MQSLILTLHIIVCVLLVILILLQSGKEGMGVLFGGGNTSVFGSTGAGGILVKLTTFMALIFVVTSLSYTYVTSSHHEQESAILDVQIEDVKPSEPTSTETVPPVVAPKEDSQANPVAPPTAVTLPAKAAANTQDGKEEKTVKASNAPNKDDKSVKSSEVKKDVKEGKASDAKKDVKEGKASDAKKDVKEGKASDAKKDVKEGKAAKASKEETNKGENKKESKAAKKDNAKKDDSKKDEGAKSSSKSKD